MYKHMPTVEWISRIFYKKKTGIFANRFDEIPHLCDFEHISLLELKDVKVLYF